MYRTATLLLLMALLTGCASVSSTAIENGAPSASPKGNNDIKPYHKVVTADAVSDEGLFTLHRLDEKLYYEIPDSLFGVEMLVVSRIARTAENIGYGGSKAHTRVVRWQRRDDQVLLREVSYENVADPEDPIYRAVENANFEPILMTFDVRALHEDSQAVVIDVTELYTKDVPALGLPKRRREAYKVRGLDGDRSFISSSKSFPRNIEIDHVLTYNAQEPPANASTNTISLEMSQSMVLLPRNPMTPRRCDARVGYFNVEMTDYGVEDAQEATEQCYITRWRLQPSDVAAYRRGELVEPVEPIVYYIDPATPEQWRPYLKAGVEAWQKAFEAAGFKHAIVAKDAPSEDEDPDWSPEDVRYSVIRYFPSETENAYGPHVHDPRTGEILESDIGWYHNVMSLLRDWYFVQTAAANPEARRVRFDEEVMGQLITFVAAHEVGHTLGLPHNWGSSYGYPVDSLRSPTFTATHGTAPSIMDYARFNYIAQPGDGVTNFFPQIGEYDVWSVKWGYSHFPGLASAEAREEQLDAWILERAGDPLYFYGAQSGAQIDPRSQREDLGQDAVLASTLGLKNLQRIVPNLVVWTYREGEDFQELEQIFNDVLGQWRLYIGHVTRQVGGVYETPKDYEQEGPVYEAVPAEKQREAVEFLQAQVFTRPDWLLEKEVLRRIERAGALHAVERTQARALRLLLDPQRLARMMEMEALADNGEDVYGALDMMEDLRVGLWRELDGSSIIGPFRRNLQRAYIARMANLMAEDADARPLVRGELVRLQSDIEEALPAVENRHTRLHLRDILARIESLLKPDEQ